MAREYGNNNNEHGGLEGDNRYMAPELLTDYCGKSPAMDIFSLGIMVLQITCVPVHGRRHVIKDSHIHQLHSSTRSLPLVPPCAIVSFVSKNNYARSRARACCYCRFCCGCCCCHWRRGDGGRGQVVIYNNIAEYDDGPIFFLLSRLPVCLSAACPPRQQKELPQHGEAWKKLRTGRLPPCPPTCV